jgi:drug/metabolite transporter superfamily protein YnfA
MAVSGRSIALFAAAAVCELGGAYPLWLARRLWRCVRRRVAHRLLREIRDESATRLPDALGTVLLIASIGLLTLGLVRGPDWSWDGRVIGAFATALALGAVFAVRTAWHPAPVLELPLLRVPVFALASVAALLFFAAFGALLLSNVLFTTGVWHYSVLEAGFALSVGPMFAAIFAAVSGRLASRWGPAAVGAPGGALFAAGAGWLIWQLGTGPDYLGAFLPSQIVAGMGIGLMLPSFTAAAVSTLASERLATGIGVQTTFRQIGTALGIAAWVAIVGTPSPRHVLDAFDHGFAFVAACAAAAGLTMAVVAVVAGRGDRRRQARGGRGGLRARRCDAEPIRHLELTPDSAHPCISSQGC